MTELFADEFGAAILAARILGGGREPEFAGDTAEYGRPGEYGTPGEYRRGAEYGRPGDFSGLDYWEFCRAFAEAHEAARGRKPYYREVEGKGGGSLVFPARALVRIGAALGGMGGAGESPGGLALGAVAALRQGGVDGGGAPRGRGAV